MTLQNIAESFAHSRLVGHVKKFHRDVEQTALRRLTKEQLDLVYCILGGIPLGIVLYTIHPLIVLGGMIGLQVLNEVKPNLLRRNAWATIDIAFGLNSFICAGTLGYAAFRTQQTSYAIFAGIDLFFGAFAFYRVRQYFNKMN